MLNELYIKKMCVLIMLENLDVEFEMYERGFHYLEFPVRGRAQADQSGIHTRILIYSK